MRAAREAWFEGQPDLDPDWLVFLDETATNTKMARRYGRAPRRTRCRMAVPQGHDKTTTVTAALRTSGPTAIALFERATNGERFRAYVADTLVPVLKRGDTVILDNLNVHTVAGVREAIAAAGAQVRYVPAYSPDFNPIEQALAKLKALLRAAAARIIPDLRAKIRKAFARFTPQECRNYLAAAGYEDDFAVATSAETALTCGSLLTSVLHFRPLSAMTLGSPGGVLSSLICLSLSRDTDRQPSCAIAWTRTDRVNGSSQDCGLGRRPDDAERRRS